MIKIKALNEGCESSSDECTQSGLITREAQEEGLYQLYSDALKALSSGDEDLAKQIFFKLNDHLKSSSIQKIVLFTKLRFLTLKNLGLITNDLEHLLDALELDSSDVSLWLKTGLIAANANNYQLARNCYEEAHALSPKNWIAVDRLLDTYFILHDLLSCLKLCCFALVEDNGYRKASILFNEIIRLHPPFLKELTEKQKQFIDETQDEEYVSVVENLRQIKLKRKQFFEEERAKYEAKRPKLSLNLDTGSNVSIASIGMKLKFLLERIKKQNIFTSTPISISFDYGSSQTDSGGGESGSANTSADENTNIVSEQTKEKERRSGSTRSSSTSNHFPTEFVDKRRSSRVKGILNKSRDIDERNVSESILELLPDSLKTALKEENSPKKDPDQTQEKVINKSFDVNESDIIKQFTDKVKSVKARRKSVHVFDLVEDYLVTLSACKGITLPSVFMELYSIYRENHELPCPPLCVIGRELEIEHIWLVLTANEIKYNKSEALFLTQMMVPLEILLPKEKYIEYSVRLAMIRGTKENNNDFLNYALEILGDSDIEILATNKMIIKHSVIKSILESQSHESMAQMMEEQNFEELLKILMSKPESELNSCEIKLINDAIIDSKSWQKGIEFFSGRNELDNNCLGTIRKCLETGKRGRLTHQLAVKLVKLAAEGYSVLPWICIYWGIIAEGDVAINSKSTIIKFLKLGHQYLGKRGTCTSHNGEFLLQALQHFIECDVEDEILKCFTCLFNFPQRKVPNPQSSSSSSIHTSPHIKLKWEHCEALYQYFAPEELPEYDSLIRMTGITQDIEALFLRIVDLVPESLHPSKHSKFILQYIEAGDEIPNDLSLETSQVTETIFYFLADYYFKNKEFNKAVEFYLLDLSLNPNRFDSWAGSALSRTFQLDQQLITGDNTDSRFNKQAHAVLRCFDRALKLEPTNTKLWIEYGHFAYNISSHASRWRKTALFIQTPSGTLTQADHLQTQHEEMITISKYCFESANNTDSMEEIWLPYYMLGKVMEKSNNLLSAIRYYEWAELCLYADGTSYPKKIQYHNPPALAVESLEIHYRIHAATLKFLTSSKKFSTRYLKRLKMHLIRALRTPFTKQLTPSSATSAAPMDHDYASAGAANLSNSQGRINDAVTELMGDMIDYVCEKETKSDGNKIRDDLITLCLNGMKRCLSRYPAHYKSLYRLSHYYHVSQDNITAKAILLGSPANLGRINPKLINEIDNESAVNQENPKIISGLFSERKTSNLFNGIWRIPIDDIDRPGSFNAHMFRCTFLLIRVCTYTEDYQTLCTIAQQLSRTPDIGKRYLKDADRKLLARFAFESCSVLLKARIVSSIHLGKDKILTDIQRIVDRFIKANVFVSEANALLRDIHQLIRR